MAPILTYLRIHKDTTIPVRLSINLQKSRNKEFFQSAINVQNNTRLIKLTKIQKIYLSNNQIRDILTVFQNSLIDLLLVDSIDLLKLKSERLVKNFGNKDTLSFVLNDTDKTGWKIRVKFTVSWLENLRSGNYDVNDMLVRIPRASNNDKEDDESAQILQEEPKEIAIPQEGEEVIEIPDDEDVKFEQKYDYKRRHIYHLPLEIEVLQAPVKKYSY